MKQAYQILKKNEIINSEQHMLPLKKTFKHMKKIITILIIVFVSASLTTCTDLEVLETNNVSTEEALSDPEGIKSLAAALFNTWYYVEQHNINSPGPAMWVMADWGTVTFANYATQDMSVEPRIPLNNTASYAYHATIRKYWQKMYAVVTTANDVITAIDNGIEIGENGEETMMVKGMGYFMQGLGNGYIGLVFDKGYPSDENTDYVTLEQAPYTTSIDMAIAQLEKAIEVFDNNTFTLPEEWMSGSFDNVYMSKLAHSFIARLMIYSARNTTQRDAVDWSSVLTHAQSGITEDFAIQGDGDISNRKWMSWYKYYMARQSWGKVDMRVIHMLDNDIPANWPDDGISALPNSGMMNSIDIRVYTDFQYDANNIRPERGLYRWSTYRYTRMDDYINNYFFAPVILMRKAENDLFIAEAYARLDQYDNARDAINSGTRTNRGYLPTITNDPTEVLDAIFYERTIELPLTGMGIEYFDMRRNGLLQDGSLLHFPIPAQQLDIILEPNYTFGGVSPQFGVPNEDVSINGWYTP
jgi:hypothetical protein